MSRDEGKSILLLGATGASGQIFIKTALAQTSGPRLTLFVRSRSKLDQSVIDSPRVRVVDGSLTDENALLDAMSDVDTVVSFLGAYVTLSAFIWRTTTTPIADSFPVVFKAMKAKGVKRILALSTLSYQVTPETHSWGLWVYLLIPAAVVPQGNAEMVAIAKQLAAQDDLEWTVFRVPQLTNGDAEAKVWAGLLGPEYRGTLDLSRGSMVKWVMKELEERKWVRGAPALGNY